LSEGFEPAYKQLLETGELEARVRSAWERLRDCDLCARYCHVNRFETIKGAVCRTGEEAIVNSYGAHHGEEDPLRGWRGSGTIFFSWCNLRCEFCQNWEISQKGAGRASSPEAIAGMMLELQDQGCHNINFVTPSHVVAQILAAVEIAARNGLDLPLVYNTGGYDSPEALALLDGVIDIYMPDMKYGDNAIARRYSHVRNYWEVNQAAVLEMHRQVGDLVLDEGGIARRGLLIRHLVLPGDLANSEKVFAFIAEKVSRNSYLNVMAQYHPAYRAHESPQLDRLLGQEEYGEALRSARRHGLAR
jgi:putative pyruvate formate lyase activating enzyme